MDSIVVISPHEPGYLSISVFVAIKFINSNALILEDPVESFNMSIFIWCSSWYPFMTNIYFCAGILKHMANKLWAIVCPDYRLDCAIKQVSLNQAAS